MATWFCDGIAEEILNALTPLKGLRGRRFDEQALESDQSPIFDH
jgi:hypothetical protein